MKNKKITKIYLREDTPFKRSYGNDYEEGSFNALTLKLKGRREYEVYRFSRIGTTVSFSIYDEGDLTGNYILYNVAASLQHHPYDPIWLLTYDKPLCKDCLHREMEFEYNSLQTDQN